MKPLIRTILLLTALASPADFAAATPPEAAQASAKEAELQRLRDAMQDLNNNLGNLRSQHQEQRTKLRTLNRKINQLNRSLHDTEEQRNQQTDNLARLQRDKRDKQEQLAGQRLALAQQLRAAYLMGQQGSLKLLLNATEPAALERSLIYYDYFYRSRTQHIATLNDTLHTLDTLEKSIQGKQHELDGLLDRQRTQHETLESSRRERAALLAALNHDIRSTRQRLSQLKEDEQTLQELVKRLRQALARIPAPRGPGQPFARLKGRLRLPAAGAITARFGASRQVGQLKWQGILINAADGTDVKAVAAGRVVFADWLRGYGLLLILDHGDGYMSLYGYNQGLRVNVGDAVTAGEIVATVGSNGEHNPAGLYFEIRHQGSPVDPLLWCNAR